jgi:hypothetical protein
MRIFASFVQCRKMRASIYQKIAHGPPHLLAIFSFAHRQKTFLLRSGWQQVMYATLKRKP